mmetsp:Transcript_69450/g.165536  ORF Transcript_69450/g.165536 Transcript_69450/m.165536 type:complete len:273 (+) Transcript_69450:170-988(+)
MRHRCVLKMALVSLEALDVRCRHNDGLATAALVPVFFIQELLALQATLAQPEDLGSHKVHKGIAHVHARGSVHRDVHEVVQALEAQLVQALHKLLPVQLVRNIPDHRRGDLDALLRKLLLDVHLPGHLLMADGPTAAAFRGALGGLGVGRGVWLGIVLRKAEESWRNTWRLSGRGSLEEGSLQILRHWRRTQYRAEVGPRFYASGEAYRRILFREDEELLDGREMQRSPTVLHLEILNLHRLLWARRTPRRGQRFARGEGGSRCAAAPKGAD